MRAFLILGCLATLAVILGGVSAPPSDRAVLVEPPVRLITQCELTAVRNEDLLCREDGHTREIRLPMRITVWRSMDSEGTASLRIGDMLDIKMSVDESGREVAQFIWANLVKVEGVIRGWGRGWIEVVEIGTGPRRGRMSTRVSLSPDTQFLGGTRLRDLHTGRPVVVIGMRHDDERVEAARILAGRTR